MTNLPQRTLGSTGPTVSALGLGLMGMSDLYGPADEQESIATIHAALDAGVTLLDTGDFYGMGHNELLLREALRGRNRDNAVISVKFGALRGPDGSWIGVDTRPAAIKNFLAYTPAPPRHRPHRHLPAGPPRPERADRGDRRRARRAGRRPATSGTSASPRSAPTPCAGPHAVHPIADLQIEYSLISRGIEDEILPDGARARHRHHGLRRALPRAALRPLERGPRGPGLPRRTCPASAARTSSATSPWSRRCAPSPRSAGATVAQVAIAWVLSRGEDIVPLVGARRRDRLSESLGAPGPAAEPE